MNRVQTLKQNFKLKRISKFFLLSFVPVWLLTIYLQLLHFEKSDIAMNSVFKIIVTIFVCTVDPRVWLFSVIIFFCGAATSVVGVAVRAKKEPLLIPSILWASTIFLLITLAVYFR